ncbi:poly-gamma-glutamate synthesis protein (capsule biosynthesis protein) [Propionibacterium cyclohexanicum]|uniref:Poly-gamma-glutamate synthesis protein (Capsule biosynthesis protein) n=1 Tax=Propionibacterium cyclohexanicum TaxID=64702 RepID=A0A1H9U097_9ACTN|nr:CapA family protein [Propionibacterium cyclohexanicum]SES02668.1 poly-gamma-glutamate synthesis protein (capsule biosynthesis protein) [Propionibacterium cyclohexanicum]
MKITPDDMAGAATLNAALARCISEHEREIADTLRRVSSGDLAMVETASDAEKELVRALCRWMAGIGPVKAWTIISAAVSAALTEYRQGADPAALLAVAARVAHDEINIPDPGYSYSPSLTDIQRYLQELVSQEPHGIVGVAVLALSYICYDQFHFPQPETDVYDIANSTFDKLKWLYRYWYNQLEVAEHGSGLEEFFRSQVLVNSLSIDSNAVESVQRVSLSCAGDLLAVDALLTGDTEHLFDGIVDFYRRADIVSANLECTVDKNAPAGRTKDPGKPYRMNTTAQMFQKFRDDAGITYFSTATNHANDWGTDGILATLDVLNTSGAEHSGTAATETERQRITIVDTNGIKVALLAYTFDLNGRALPADMAYLANEVRFNDANPAPDYSLIEQQVADARRQGAEFIVAYCHWGWEFEMYPHVNIVDVAHEVVALGVDVILGNHPHVSQPAQVISRGPDQPNALVIYALGDFVSYHPYSRNSKLAYMVKFDIAKVTTAARSYVSWDNLQATPIYLVNEALGGSDYNCRILPFDDVLADPDAHGLTEREKSELPHLHNVVWEQILSPLAHIPDGGWSTKK